MIFEWFIFFRLVVTLYATLGQDALIHGINETEASMIITSFGLLPQVKVSGNIVHIYFIMYSWS